jgi:hypothetical protein
MVQSVYEAAQTSEEPQGFDTGVSDDDDQRHERAQSNPQS